MGIAVIDNLTVPYAVLLLRLSLGMMFLAHAMLKWRVYTIPGTAAFFKSVGLPGRFAQLIIAVELCGAAGLIVGIYPRYAARLLVPLVPGTIVKVHGHNGWLFSNKHGGWELPAFWTVVLVVRVSARRWGGDPRQVAGIVGSRMLWLALHLAVPQRHPAGEDVLQRGNRSLRPWTPCGTPRYLTIVPRLRCC